MICCFLNDFAGRCLPEWKMGNLTIGENLGFLSNLMNSGWNIAKGKTDTRVECFHLSSGFLIHIKSRSKSSLRILNKLQPQSIDQTTASKCWPKLSFKISTKLKPQSLEQKLISKSQPNLTLKILYKPQTQNFKQTSVIIGGLPTLFMKEYRGHWVSFFISQRHISQVSKVSVSESLSLEW